MRAINTGRGFGIGDAGPEATPKATEWRAFACQSNYAPPPGRGA
jgi:hypothetical protein